MHIAEFYPFNIDPVFNPMDMDKRSLTKAKNAYEFMNLTVGLTPWVNYRGFDSSAIETQFHTTSHVFCFMCFLNKVLSLALSQPKNSVYFFLYIYFMLFIFYISIRIINIMIFMFLKESRTLQKPEIESSASFYRISCRMWYFQKQMNKWL